MVISNGTFHGGVTALQRPTGPDAASRADDELRSTTPCLSPYLPRLYPPFSTQLSLACESAANFSFISILGNREDLEKSPKSQFPFSPFSHVMNRHP